MTAANFPWSVLQGIKFYDPEIKGDTPETVEYIGIKNLVDKCAERLGLECGKFLLDPSTGKLSVAWGPLDDVVMGGCSESKLEVERGAAEDGGYAAVFRCIPVSVGLEGRLPTEHLHC